MFRRFWPKIRVDRKRHRGRSFSATINCLIWYDVELVGLQNCHLGLSKCWKFQKIKNISFFPLKKSPQNQNFLKTYYILEGNVWWICIHNFKSVSSKMVEIWHKTCQKQSLFTSFWDFTVIFRFFLTDFEASKSVLGSFFAFFAKVWPNK